ncbi:MAG: hypothetical protein JXR48_11865 [Candidatus Delongbacteria bacterium]|nr:hypothetical protein [Candidatus Delongbacteria bacterium]MBN2835648.1 hypothetical protein [Candidatus Delongbacteria bacterium]
MNNLRQSINILFRRISPDEVISSLFDQKIENHYTTSPPKHYFIHGAELNGFNHYSNNEISNIFSMLKQNWMSFDTHNNGLKKSIYNTLLNFTSSILVEKEGEPFVKFTELLRWRDLSLKLGEDLFTTIFFAYNDVLSQKIRSNFSWRPIISSDNYQLKNILSKGIAENHFHLKGSAPHFSLAWTCLMNNVSSCRGQYFHKTFKELFKESKLEPNLVISFKNNSPNIHTLIKKAAYIRLFLFYILNDLKTETTNSGEESIFSFSNIKSVLFGDSNINIQLPLIESEMNSIKAIFGYKFDGEVLDYFIPKNPHIINFNHNIPLYGERYFLYSFFRELYGEDKKNVKRFQDLLYVYLLIKSHFREEFVQVNNRVGFDNFAKYQDRKTYFIPKNSIYEKALYNLAINASRKNQNITKFETRIAPNNSSSALKSQISDIDNFVQSKVFSRSDYDKKTLFLRKLKEQPLKNQNKHFYVTHFIKLPDEIDKNFLISASIPRNNKVRKSVKEQAFAITELRNSVSDSSKRILGIDAANFEVGCRPEVFAQAFRFLKNHYLRDEFQFLRVMKDYKENKLRSTFHAGEDFLDIIDGLRAIDESVKFLNLTNGDRIGHALALGVDVKEYYEGKGFHIVLPMHDLLDNIVWMIARIRKHNLNVESLMYKLVKVYNNLFQNIYGVEYGNATGSISHNSFYDAWKLRGDSPDLYKTGKFNKCNELTYWDRSGYNYNYPNDKNQINGYDIRKNEVVSKLYFNYHFNPNVKKKGSEMTEYKIDSDYIDAVIKIQKAMQLEIHKKHIGIETNPSSNYLIGTFKRYAKHPLMKFNNLGLTYDSKELAENPQLFVSINTDDQGVFNTYLENEYALMAIALEKELDINGKLKYNQTMIYDWLNRIREMGLEMSFQDKELK